MALKLKLDAEGKPVMKDNLPVFVYDDGKEITIDADALFTKVSEVSAEAARYRTEGKTLKEQLALFGEADPAEVSSQLALLKEIGGKDGLQQLKAKSGIDIEAIKTNMTNTYEGKLKEKDSLLASKDGEIYKLLVTNGFGTSKFIADNLILPPDIAEATFAKHFKVEDGKMVPYMGDHKILSRERPTEIANFDEAMEVIVANYPMKDRILKGTGAAGGGAQQNNGGQGGANSINRATFNSYTPQAKSAFMTGGGTVVD